MGRGIRHQNPERFYFVTNRCHQQKYLMRPDKRTNQMIRGCLARAAYQYNIELAGWIFMSNHFHLIARAPNRNLDDFMEQFQGQLATRLNKHRGRSGPVFPKRYNAEPILDDASLRERIGYTLNNPVAAGLVSHPSKWKGVSSYNALKRGKPLKGGWVNHTKKYELSRKGAKAPRRQATERYDIKLTFPPEFEETSPTEARASLLESIESHRKGVALTQRPRRRFAGWKYVARLDWNDSPENPKQSQQPLCHASTPDAYDQFYRQMRSITDDYIQASRRYRNGKKATFPAGTTPPGWHRCLSRRQTFQKRPQGP